LHSGCYEEKLERMRKVRNKIEKRVREFAGETIKNH